MHLRYHCRGCNRIFVEQGLDGILARALSHRDPAAVPAECGDEWRMVLWAELPPFVASQRSEHGAPTDPWRAEREGTSIHA